MLITILALAQSSGGEFTMTRSVVAGGGGRSAGGDYELVGTMAQPIATTRPSTGARYALTGGFWGAGRDILLIDGFEDG